MPSRRCGTVAVVMLVFSLVCLIGLLAWRWYAGDTTAGLMDAVGSLGVLLLWVGAPALALRAWVVDGDRGWLLLLTPVPLLLAIGVLLVGWVLATMSAPRESSRSSVWKCQSSNTRSPRLAARNES